MLDLMVACVCEVGCNDIMQRAWQHLCAQACNGCTWLLSSRAYLVHCRPNSCALACKYCQFSLMQGECMIGCVG